ncbi:PUA-like domain-containing protein [Lasiosphaeria miniovina]|uniref:Thymocyte nuclear protein 1 n=1 Tax=Lasiosphaeria miniovina TaxID=1954250 RepID=A0AA40DTD3_9PEZI|nr:PUA-like domain-containing protein [Lasiosphaeria miniovina]KAK0712642.1 PUA-like domain-containing protein [Lasiosphaeria miniovina]
MPKRKSTAGAEPKSAPRRSLRNSLASAPAAQEDATPVKTASKPVKRAAGPSPAAAKPKKPVVAEANKITIRKSAQKDTLEKNKKADPDETESEPQAESEPEAEFESECESEPEAESEAKSEPQAKRTRLAVKAPVAKAKTAALAAAPKSSDGKNFWLMKAEPESRIEKGIDVRFSIDDLAAKKKPEPWDGIRSYPARNNLRAMKKGDLAFFYHSNCKEPGIVGVMEIVKEHTPDLTAHDPKQPYYDAKSDPADPKWSVVHVEFRSKFVVPIGLKELREMGEAGKPLANMQMLKQTRLSVSKVTAEEWQYIIGVAKDKVAGK